MVFICNKCGDRMRIKDAGTHVRKCSPLALTCLNCDKNFDGDKYAAHSNCIKKVEGKKAKVKWNKWNHIIQKVSEATDLTTHQRTFLNSLAKKTTFPKFKKPFLTFARDKWRDSFCRTNVIQPLVHQVFSLMELKLMTEQQQMAKGYRAEDGMSSLQQFVSAVLTASKAPENGAHQTSLVDALLQHGNAKQLKTTAQVVDYLWMESHRQFEDQIEQLFNRLDLQAKIMPQETGVKQKKQDKKIVDVLKVNGEVLEENREVVAKDTTSKKIKKGKQKRYEEEVLKKVVSGDRAEDTVVEDKNTNRKKRKHKISEEAVEEIKETGNEAEVVEGDATSKKSKKKKHKRQEDEAEEIKENVNKAEVVEGDAMSKKSKKKKHKRQEDEAEEIKENGNEAEVVEGDAMSKKNKHKRQEEEVKEQHKPQEFPVEEEDVPRKKSKKIKHSE